MYTELDNIKHANKIKGYIAKNPSATRWSIHQDCLLSYHRIMYLERNGYAALPKPMPYAYRNGLKQRNV